MTLAFILHSATARDNKWHQAFLLQPHLGGRGLGEASLLSSLSPGYWCFVVDGTFDGPSVDYCVYSACKLGTLITSPRGESLVRNRACVFGHGRQRGCKTEKVSMMIEIALG